MDPSRWQNLGYLFWAYTAFWLLLAGYLVMLTSRVSRLKHDLDALRTARRDPRDASDA